MSAPLYAAPDRTMRNMYDCTPCPKCRDTYRYPMKDGLIHCDGCRYTEPWDALLRKQLTGEDEA